MRRLARLFARLYPAAWRERYGAEFDALLEEARPRALNVLAGALRAQVMMGSIGKLMLTTSIAGMLLAFGLSFAFTRNYQSVAWLRISRAEVSGEQSAPQRNGANWDAIQALRHKAIGASALLEIIGRRNLYSHERARKSNDELAQMMDRQIQLRPLLQPGGNWVVPGFEIVFEYPDAEVAQTVAADLMARLIEENVRADHDGFLARQLQVNVFQDGDRHQLRVEPLATASLPVSPVGPGRMSIATGGLFVGLLAGMGIWLVRRRATSTGAR